MLNLNVDLSMFNVISFNSTLEFEVIFLSFFLTIKSFIVLYILNSDLVFFHIISGSFSTIQICVRLVHLIA